MSTTNRPVWLTNAVRAYADKVTVEYNAAHTKGKPLTNEQRVEIGKLIMADFRIVGRNRNTFMAEVAAMIERAEKAQKEAQKENEKKMAGKKQQNTPTPEVGEVTKPETKTAMVPITDGKKATQLPIGNVPAKAAVISLEGAEGNKSLAFSVPISSDVASVAADVVKAHGQDLLRMMADNKTLYIVGSFEVDTSEGGAGKAKHITVNVWRNVHQTPNITEAIQAFTRTMTRMQAKRIRGGAFCLKDGEQYRIATCGL